VTVSGYGPVGAYLAERFPTAVRSSGYGMSYSLSIVLPALYPYYLPPLQNLFGDHTAIAMLLVVAGLLVMTGALAGPETSKIRKLQ
jgi:amino acid permease